MDTLEELIVVWRALIRCDGSRGNEQKSPIHFYDVVRMMGESKIIKGNNGASADDDGCDIAEGTDYSDNGPDGHWSTEETNGADSPEGHQIAKDRSPAWVKGQSRKQPPDSPVEALTGRITTFDNVSKRLHHKWGHYTESRSMSGGLITSAGNQSS